jgi:hypothetical protein
MGKSSLAYACLQRGFSLITEDSVQVKALPGGGYRVFGMPWKLHLLPDARSLFPGLSRVVERVQINGERKLELDVESAFPGAARVSTSPAALFFLERATGADTCLSALSAEETRQRMQVIWTWGIGWSALHEQAVDRLLELPAYLLAMNGSPEDAALAMEGVLLAGNHR